MTYQMTMSLHDLVMTHRKFCVPCREDADCTVVYALVRKMLLLHVWSKVFRTVQRAGIFLSSPHAPVDWENVTEMSRFTQGHRPDDVRWAEALSLPGKHISVCIGRC